MDAFGWIEMIPTKLAGAGFKKKMSVGRTVVNPAAFAAIAIEPNRFRTDVGDPEMGLVIAGLWSHRRALVLDSQARFVVDGGTGSRRRRNRLEERFRIDQDDAVDKFYPLCRQETKNKSREKDQQAVNKAAVGTRAADAAAHRRIICPIGVWEKEFWGKSLGSWAKARVRDD